MFADSSNAKIVYSTPCVTPAFEASFEGSADAETPPSGPLTIVKSSDAWFKWCEAACTCIIASYRTQGLLALTVGIRHISMATPAT